MLLADGDRLGELPAVLTLRILNRSGRTECVNDFETLRARI